jgi:undecaprenyl-diphosphatase
MLQAFVLGIVQGLGEFLPISSSAHLILAPWLFNWPDQGLGFDVALHWGTLLAVVVYFRKDILLIIKGFWHSLFKSTRDLENNIYQRLSWLLVIASIPAAIFGKLLEHTVETSFRNPLLIAATLSVVGLILWTADVYGRKQKTLAHISKWQALIIGCSQAIALIPGVSRSGATMTTGLFLGFTAQDAARFSFLMSIPVTLGAGLLKLPEFHQGVTTLELIVGFATSAIVGFLAIKFLLRYLSTRSFGIFVWYRLALAAVIVIVYFSRG